MGTAIHRNIRLTRNIYVISGHIFLVFKVMEKRIYKCLQYLQYHCGMYPPSIDSLCSLLYNIYYLKGYLCTVELNYSSQVVQYLTRIYACKFFEVYAAYFALSPKPPQNGTFNGSFTVLKCACVHAAVYMVLKCDCVHTVGYVG